MTKIQNNTNSNLQDKLTQLLGEEGISPIEKSNKFEMSYKEIAGVMGITEKEVIKLEKSAIKKLRHPKIGNELRKLMWK